MPPKGVGFPDPLSGTLKHSRNGRTLRPHHRASKHASAMMPPISAGATRSLIGVRYALFINLAMDHGGVVSATNQDVPIAEEAHRLASRQFPRQHVAFGIMAPCTAATRSPETRARSNSLNHLISPCKQRWGDLQAQRLHSLEIDRQVVVARLKEWHFCWRSALEYLIDLTRRVTRQTQYINRVGHKTASLNEVRVGIESWQPRILRQLHNQSLVRGRDWAFVDNERGKLFTHAGS